MHITLTVTVLVVFTIVGGLIILLWPGLYQKLKALRYIAGVVLIVLGILALLGIHIPYVN
jgi:cytochrome c biogenesis protein CcdA